MIRSRTTTRPRFALSTLAGYLQLAGLLLGVIALREIQVSGAGPLMLVVFLVGAATLTGAALLRRRWMRSTLPADVVAVAGKPSGGTDASTAGLHGEFRDAAFSSISMEMWRWQTRRRPNWQFVPLPAGREIKRDLRIRLPK